MTITDAQAWLALAGGLTTVIITTIASVLAMLASHRNGKKIEENTAITKTIEVNTNSRLAEVDKKLSDRDAKVDELLSYIHTQELIRAQLATDTARGINLTIAAVEAAAVVPPPLIKP